MAEIRRTLEAEPKAGPKSVPYRDWKIWAVAAIALIAAGLVLRLWWPKTHVPAGSEEVQTAAVAGDRDFLTDQALQEVERTESAYRQSIAKLSRLAQPELQNSASALTVNYREKLLLLDSAISETRANLEHNRFNVHLRTELADLYREKQETLKELLTRDRKN